MTALEIVLGLSVVAQWAGGCRGIAMNDASCSSCCCTVGCGGSSMVGRVGDAGGVHAYEPLMRESILLESMRGDDD